MQHAFFVDSTSLLFQERETPMPFKAGDEAH